MAPIGRTRCLDNAKSAAEKTAVLFQSICRSAWHPGDALQITDSPSADMQSITLQSVFPRFLLTIFRLFGITQPSKFRKRRLGNILTRRKHAAALRQIR